MGLSVSRLLSGLFGKKEMRAYYSLGLLIDRCAGQIAVAQK
jgi:hypothetical protein